MSNERHSINLGSYYWVEIDGAWHKVKVFAGESITPAATFRFNHKVHTRFWNDFYDEKPEAATKEG